MPIIQFLYLAYSIGRRLLICLFFEILCWKFSKTVLISICLSQKLFNFKCPFQYFVKSLHNKYFTILKSNHSTLPFHTFFHLFMDIFKLIPNNDTIINSFSKWNFIIIWTLQSDNCYFFTLILRLCYKFECSIKKILK